MTTERVSERENLFYGNSGGTTAGLGAECRVGVKDIELPNVIGLGMGKLLLSKSGGLLMATRAQKNRLMCSSEGCQNNHFRQAVTLGRNKECMRPGRRDGECRSECSTRLNAAVHTDKAAVGKSATVPI